MEKMTLNKALKAKKRLATELNRVLGTISEYNSTLEGSPEHYDVKSLIEEAKIRSYELAMFKSDIHKANGPVLDKIFMLSELKSLRGQLNGVSTEDGVVKGSYGESNSTYVAQVNVVEMSTIIDELETKIDELQDELDTYNATTYI